MDAKARAIADADDLSDVVRPFVWLAAVAFSAGFWGYLALTPIIVGS